MHTSRHKPLAGTITALVTPFQANHDIDWPALERLIAQQLEHGIDALCICGTTAESATLRAEEREAIISRAVKTVRGRVPVIAGTGSNSTHASCLAQSKAHALGADYGLVVTPYYNKPTQSGLVQHYQAVAKSCTMPVLIYNVPGRTGCDILPETIATLSQIDNIVGVKEATGDVTRVAALRNKIQKPFALLSGDDATACAFTLMGGDGVISVTSNLVPQAMVDLIHAAQAADVATARAQHNKLQGLFDVLFLESNPIPVKAAMAMRQMLQETYRLPLCSMQPNNRQKVQNALEQFFA